MNFFRKLLSKEFWSRKRPLPADKVALESSKAKHGDVIPTKPDWTSRIEFASQADRPKDDEKDEKDYSPSDFRGRHAISASVKADCKQGENGKPELTARVVRGCYATVESRKGRVMDCKIVKRNGDVALTREVGWKSPFTKRRLV